MSEISIPKSFAKDRAVVSLVTQWRNLLQRHAVCCTRINWNTTRNPSLVEKKRRAERWELDARIRSIESTLLNWTAEVTHHSDIWMDQGRKHNPLDHATYSKYHQLLADYSAARRPSGPKHLERNSTNRRKTRTRHQTIRKILNLEWKWMSAIYHTVYPKEPLPPRRKADHRTLRPKRVKSVERKLSLSESSV
jgi:hypothetical protein